jgi:hypothetical protein
MPKQKEELDNSFEENLETVKPFEKKVEVSKAKIKGTVYRISETELFIVDERGCGFRFPLSKEHKNIKLGDTVSF